MKDSFSFQAAVPTALSSLIFHCLQDDGMYIESFPKSLSTVFGTFGQKNECLVSRVSFSNAWCKSILYRASHCGTESTSKHFFKQELFLFSFPSSFLVTVYRGFP